MSGYALNPIFAMKEKLYPSVPSFNPEYQPTVVEKLSDLGGKALVRAKKLGEGTKKFVSNVQLSDGTKKALWHGSEYLINSVYHTFFIEKHVNFLFDEIEKDMDGFLAVLSRKLSSSIDFRGEVERYIEKKHTFIDSVESAKKYMLPITTLLLTNIIRKEIAFYGKGKVSIPFTCAEKGCEFVYDLKTEGIIGFCPKYLTSILLHCILPSAESTGAFVRPIADSIIDWFRIKSFSKFCRTMWCKYVNDNTYALCLLLERYQTAVEEDDEDELVTEREKLHAFIEEAHKDFSILRHAFL